MPLRKICSFSSARATIWQDWQMGNRAPRCLRTLPPATKVSATGIKSPLRLHSHKRASGGSFANSTATPIANNVVFSTRQKILPCECLDRLANRLRSSLWLSKNAAESSRCRLTQKPSQEDHMTAIDFIGFDIHKKTISLPEAESSIRRQYRFGSCRRKQQSRRGECGEALLDTERGETVRSRGGTGA